MRKSTTQGSDEMPYDIVNDSVRENAAGEITEVFLVKNLRDLLQHFTERPMLTLPYVMDKVREVAEGCLHLHADGFDVMSSVTLDEYTVAVHRAIQLHDIQEQRNEELERTVEQAAATLTAEGFVLDESLLEALDRDVCECGFPHEQGAHWCPRRGTVYDGRHNG